MLLDSALASATVMEYVLAILPDAELGSRIRCIKKEFAEKYKTTGYTNGEARITVAHFQQFESFERKLIQRLNSICSNEAPFKIELRNFGSLPSHTIHINVVSKLPIQDLVKNLRQAQKLMNQDKENKVHFIEEPQIVIAQKLKPWQYEQSWIACSHSHFTGRFIADGIFLMKRNADSKTAYRVIRKFDFLGLKTVSEQGKLFG